MSYVAHLKLLTKADAADILGVCTRTIDNYIRDGILPAPKPLGSREYWHPLAFERFLAEYFGLAAEAERATDKPVGAAASALPSSKTLACKPRRTNVPKSSPAQRQGVRQTELLRQLNA